MGIHFICVDIKGAQYKCFLALLFLQPWGLHKSWLFVQVFSFSVVFLHSEASSKCNFGRGVLPQCLGHHQVWPSFRSGCWTMALPHACSLTGGSCPAQVGHRQSWVLDVLPGSGGQGELCPSQQPRGCSQGWLSLPKPRPCISTAPLWPGAWETALECLYCPPSGKLCCPKPPRQS